MFKFNNTGDIAKKIEHDKIT